MKSIWMPQEMSDFKVKRRTTQITVRLEPKVLEGLSDIANRIGIAPTTLAGVAIGEYVAKSQAGFANASLLQEAMGRELAKAIATPLASVFEGKTADELKELFKDD